MTAPTHSETTASNQKDRNSTIGIWIAILLVLVVLGGAVTLFGLPGLVSVMVVAAVGMLIVLIKIITEGV